MPPSRRDLLATVGSLAVLSFCELAFSRRAFASSVSPILGAWLRDVNELARSVHGEAITQASWRAQMEALYGRVPFAELLQLVDLDALAQRSPPPAQGEGFVEVPLPTIEGLPERPAFYRAVAGFRAGRSIPPHAHNHLVSSFLVLKGALRGRHFDRIRDDDDGSGIWIAAASDRAFGPGDCSTVSQDRNNVHWFTAETDHSYIIDFGVGGLAPAGTTAPLAGQDPDKAQNRIYLDIDPRALEAPGKITNARRVTESEAYRRYG